MPSPSPSRSVPRLLYGAYALGTLFVLLVLAALLALLLPRLAWRRASTCGLARLWLRLAALRVTVLGLERLPPGSCVLVANHGSYLDGVVMKAALPPRFSFVVKSEAAGMPVVGLLLSRIGTEFVDRASRGGRLRAAKRVMRRAEQGHSLAFFPEGTFDELPGLKRFHIGAFVAAARGGLPLVPAVIRGARQALPSGRLIPRPGPITVEILAPLAMADGGGGAEDLRDEARRRMLANLEEPDLAPPAAG